MNTLNKLLDKAREVCSSDAEIGKHLGVSRSAVSLWRAGGKITPAHLAKLIQLTQQDPALSVQVLAEQEASPEERRMWAVLWDRLSPVTTSVAGVLLMVGLWAPWPAQAMTRVQAEPGAALYIMCNWLRRLVARFASMERRFGAVHASAVLA